MSASHVKPTPVFPRMINLETISSCNAKCVFCPHPLLDKNKNVQRMGDNLFQKIIDECAMYTEGIREICFGVMNEPMMDRKLLERIAYARTVTQGRVLIVLITNGSLLTPRKIDEMLENPPDAIKISVTGPTAASYEKGMVGLSYRKVMRNLEYLSSALKGRVRPAVEISSVFTDDVAEAGFENLQRHWAEQGFGFAVINVENRGGTLSDKMTELSSQRWEVRSWCSRPSKQINIMASGKVVLCCADWREEVDAGNVHLQSIHDIWHGPVLTYYRDHLGSGTAGDLNPCANCMQAEVVVGGQAVRKY